jgi:hypothetical protein
LAGVHLFSLYEYNRAFTRFVGEAIHELMARKDPVLGRIKSERSEQIPIVRNTMPSGEVVEGQPLRTETSVAVTLDDVVSGDVDEFAAALDDTATKALAQVMPRFFERIGGLSEAAGTTVDARAEPLSYELLLRGFEKIDIDFDDNGNPIMPKLVVGPDMFEALRKLPPETEQQQRAWREMIERKRREFNDRRRYRKLS